MTNRTAYYGKNIFSLFAPQIHLRMSKSQRLLRHCGRWVRCVSVQMRGGSIRYQAQNLRNVHIPAWCSLEECDVAALVRLYVEKDISKVNACVDGIITKVSGRQPARISEQFFDFS